MQQPLSLHRYLYTNANPVNLVDPSGQTNLTEVSTSLFIYGTFVGELQFGVGKLANYVHKNAIRWNGANINSMHYRCIKISARNLQFDGKTALISIKQQRRVPEVYIARTYRKLS